MQEKRQAILTVAFGTSVSSAKKAIDNLVESVKREYPNYSIRVAYTSNIIRRKIEKERDEFIPTPLQALANLQEEGYKDVYVLPMHILPGEEFDDLESVVSSVKNITGKYAFNTLKLGRPFLKDIPACNEMADILIKRYRNEIANERTIVLMGHGTPKHTAHALYAQLQVQLTKKAPGKFVIGTVEGTPDITDVVNTLKHIKAQKITLSPFMIVAGDHAKNDMADANDEESWFSIIRDAGFCDIELRLEGMGEDSNIASLYLKRMAETIG